MELLGERFGKHVPGVRSPGKCGVVETFEPVSHAAGAIPVKPPCVEIGKCRHVPPVQTARNGTLGGQPF